MKQPITFIFGRKEVQWEMNGNKLYIKHKGSKDPEVIFEFDTTRAGAESATHFITFMVMVLTNVAHLVGRNEIIDEMKNKLKES